jgi:hypothetical protein
MYTNTFDGISIIRLEATGCAVLFPLHLLGYSSIVASPISIS